MIMGLIMLISLFCFSFTLFFRSFRMLD